ncbi:hypothetical protein ACI2UC_23255 [Ralstonia nicotianae]
MPEHQPSPITQKQPPERQKKLKITHKLLAIVSLFTCQSIYALNPSDQKISHQISNNSEIRCPATNFPQFLHKFSDDKNTQKSFTKYPLKKYQLDFDVAPDPRRVVHNLDRHQIQFPVIPSSLERAKQQLKLRIDNVSSSEAKVTLFKPDTDYQISYHFKKNSCWTLEKIEDWSL